jgi:hypothetical protein
MALRGQSGGQRAGGGGFAYSAFVVCYGYRYHVGVLMVNNDAIIQLAPITSIKRIDTSGIIIKFYPG